MEANREKYAADLSSIKEAHDRIKPYIHRTPVLTSESLNSISGRSLFFKCECFQKGWEYFLVIMLDWVEILSLFSVLNIDHFTLLFIVEKVELSNSVELAMLFCLLMLNKQQKEL